MFVKRSNSVILHSYNFICFKKRKIVPVPVKAEGCDFSYSDVVKMYISMILLLHCRYFILITDNILHQKTDEKTSSFWTIFTRCNEIIYLPEQKTRPWKPLYQFHRHNRSVNNKHHLSKNQFKTHSIFFSH